MSRACRYLITIFGFVLATAGFILGFWVIPNVINSKVDDSIKLVEGTEAFERWKNIPVPLQLKVYFFNVTNPDGVQNNEKPIVQEVGPYIFEQYENKYQITKDHENLRYLQNHTIFFNAKASEPLNEKDPLIVANLPMMSIINTMKYEKSQGERTLFNSVIGAFSNNATDLFLRTTPKDFLFDGIYFNCKQKKFPWILDRICSKIMDEAPEQLTRIKNKEEDRLKFSLLSYKNFTDDGWYKINSGEKVISLLGEISEWKDSSDLKVWQPNSTCNAIYGTDTTIFAPRPSKNSLIKVFQSDICRSVYLHFDKEVEYKGITALRYIVKEDMLGSPSSFSQNKCFCLNRTGGILGDDGCLLDGAMELKNCLKSPIVLTFPHFYMGHEKYQSTVDGFKPKQTTHETFVDLELNTGVVLRGSKRAQFNIFYEPVENITLTKNLRKSLMPVVWIDQGIELNDIYIDKLNSELLTPKLILEIVYWSMIGVGLFVGIVGLVCICLQR